MDYAFLLWPHANPRYRASLASLAEAELALMLRAIDREAELTWRTLGGAPWLCFASDAFSAMEWRLLSQLSSAYVLAERRGDQLLPIDRDHPAYIGEDLAALQKYKGKTNEMFTDLLLNAALASSDFARAEQPLTVLDPLCGRGTALFLALRRGYDSCGIDQDKGDIKELNDFFSRYLEYHRMKHKKTETAMTLGGKLGGRMTRYDLADTPEHYKAGDTRSLRVVLGDTRDAAALVGKGAFHLLTADLPYGVQHAPQAGQKPSSLPALMQAALPGWLAALKPGGAAAIAFNTYTLGRDDLKAWMRNAGFTVCEGGAYEGMAHWVEQAVNRDVVVGTKA